MRAYRNGVFSMTKMRIAADKLRTRRRSAVAERAARYSRCCPKRWLKLMLGSMAMIRNRSQAEVSRTIPVERPFRIVAAPYAA